MKEERLKVIFTLESLNTLDINQQIILNLVSKSSTST